MSDEDDIIMGEVENGWRGVAAFSFWSGPVGVRQQDGFLEVAYYSEASWRDPKLPETGTIDGVAYEVVQARRPARKGDAAILVARAMSVEVVE